VIRRISLGWALVATLLGACQQTLLLDDRGADAGRTGTGGAGVGPKDASSPDAHCPGGRSTMISYTSDQPQILVALDRSSTMNSPFGSPSSPTISGFALNTILSAVDNYGGTRDTRSEIQFLFLDFPDDSSGCNSSVSCCSSDVTMNYQAFATAANPCNGGGGPAACYSSPDRPIGRALWGAGDYYMFNTANQHSNERYVLLITNGDPQGSCSPDDCNDAIMATAALNDRGVTTDVVEIGAANTGCLTLLANAQPTYPSPFYLASTQSELANVINQIVLSVAQNACRLTLTQTPASGQIAVYNNGMQVLPDSGTTGNGWTYGGNDSLRVFLHGTLCTSFLLQNPNSPMGLTIYDACSTGHPGASP
jgi:hypothetical protein